MIVRAGLRIWPSSLSATRCTLKWGGARPNMEVYIIEEYEEERE